MTRPPLQEAIAEALGKRKYGPKVEDYRDPGHTRWPWLMELAAGVVPVVEAHFAAALSGDERGREP